MNCDACAEGLDSGTNIRLKTLLIIFVKAPDPGRVKTRLSPFIPKEAAAKLQAAFMRDILQSTRCLPCERALACAPTTEHSLFHQIKKEENLRLIPQKGADLGERMHHALKRGFSLGFKKVILLGCDAPTLPIAYIQEAIDHLDLKHLVLGPSRDGGYYLLGATPPPPDLFFNIPWGTGTVLKDSLDRLSHTNDPCHLLPYWYDVDRPEDLSFLKRHLTILSKEGKDIPKETEKRFKDLEPYLIENPDFPK